MIEKRYYYTDPLAAAWMAKHFEMRFYEGLEIFEDGEPFEIGQIGILKEASRQAWNNSYPATPYVYIHPDSLHILEPQEGDLGTLDNIFYKYHGDSYLREWIAVPKLGDDIPNVCEYPEKIKIMIHNKIPFMMPEVEQ